MAGFVGAFSSFSAWWNYVSLSLRRTEQQARWSDLYDHLETYYLSNGLYDAINAANRHLAAVGGDKPESLKPLRNPANRVVEFYAAKLWPGTLPDALPIEAPNKRIVPAIEQVWQWSNWNIEKQTCARWFATFGDLFIKVATKGDPIDRVFLQNIKPRYVTAFDADERGFVTWIRIDVPRTRRDAAGKAKPYTRTEVWDLEQCRVWEHEQGAQAEIASLGVPKEQAPLSAFGVDFVPFVWQPFRPIGDVRGVGAFTLALDKIDEVNRQATRLHQMLYRYNRALWASVRTGTDPQQRPLPPVKIGPENRITQDNDDDTIINLPGSTDLKSLIPAIRYTEALQVLEAQMAELSRDLPELAYYDLREADLSGKAIRLLLGDAVDRVTEARGNGEAALVRAHQMALTIGQSAGLFKDLGTYEKGDFAHEFRTRPILEIPQEERAVAIETYTRAGVPLITALRYMGATDEEIVALEKDRLAEREAQQQELGTALVNAMRRFDQGTPIPADPQPSSNGAANA